MHRRPVVDLLHRVEKQHAVEAERAGEDEVGVGVLDAARDRAEVAVAELPLEEQHLLQAALLRHLARAREMKCVAGNLLVTMATVFGGFGAEAAASNARFGHTPGSPEPPEAENCMSYLASFGVPKLLWIRILL